MEQDTQSKLSDLYATYKLEQTLAEPDPKRLTRLKREIRKLERQILGSDKAMKPYCT